LKDLIYASENLAALPSREEQQKELHWHFGRRIYIKTTCQGGNYFRKCNHGRELFSCSRLQLILKLRVKMALNCFEVQYSDVEGAGFGCLQCSEGM
jgi:hypothetical protein